MSVPRNHTAGGVIDGKFYVVGGRFWQSSTNVLEVYDPATNTWSALAPMPTARSGIGAAVWAFGGEDIDTFTLHAEVEVYDPISNSWRQLPDMPFPRHGIWASVIENKIYIPGGARPRGWPPQTRTRSLLLASNPRPHPHLHRPQAQRQHRRRRQLPRLHLLQLRRRRRQQL